MNKTLTALVAAIIITTGCLATKTPVVTTGTTTNGVPITVTNYVWAPAPVVGTITEAAGAAAPLIPPPYGTLLTLLAGLFGTGVASYVAYKNRQETVTAQGVNSTIIKAIESLGESGSTIKAAVKSTSIEKGNASDVHIAVKNTVG